MCSCSIVSASKRYAKGVRIKNGDAVFLLGDSSLLNMIGIEKVSDGALKDLQLVSGVAIKHRFSYDESEMQQEKQNCKIALLKINLQLKVERNQGDSVDIEAGDAEGAILNARLAKIRESGVEVVLSKFPIGNHAKSYFAYCGIFCVDCVPEENWNV